MAGHPRSGVTRAGVPGQAPNLAARPASANGAAGGALIAILIAIAGGAGFVELTINPDALMCALRKIERHAFFDVPSRTQSALR
jgi:hypothetical protein